jgi:hypothetical protein
MNWSNIRLPRQLEADHTAGVVRQVLTDRTVRLWPGGEIEVPCIAMTDPLKKALLHARLLGQVRCGFEDILATLENEARGIENARKKEGVPAGNRVSRLLLFSADGAERFFRHVEQLLQAHASRVLGCLLDIDGTALGKVITGKERVVKLVMAEHKEAVSSILRAMAAGRGPIVPGDDSAR